MLIQQYWRFVREHGIDLQEKIGTKDWALTREDALAAISILKKINIILLGVDILVEKNDRFIHRPESWYVELNAQAKGESADQCVEKSLCAAKEYIEKFPEDTNGKYYYVLVPGHSLPEVEEKERLELREILNQWKYLGADDGNYDWLVELILSQLRYGSDFEELKEFITKQITTHFRIPIIYNMDINSSVRQVFDWYVGGK